MSTPADSVCSDTMYLLLTGVMCRLRAAKGNRYDNRLKYRRLASLAESHTLTYPSSQQITCLESETFSIFKSH